MSCACNLISLRKFLGKNSSKNFRTSWRLLLIVVNSCSSFSTTLITKYMPGFAAGRACVSFFRSVRRCFYASMCTQCSAHFRRRRHHLLNLLPSIVDDSRLPSRALLRSSGMVPCYVTHKISFRVHCMLTLCSKQHSTKIFNIFSRFLLWKNTKNANILFQMNKSTATRNYLQLSTWKTCKYEWYEWVTATFCASSCVVCYWH